MDINKMASTTQSPTTTRSPICYCSKTTTSAKNLKKHHRPATAFLARAPAVEDFFPKKPEPAGTPVDNTSSMADIGITLKNTIAGAVILVDFTAVATVKGASASYPTAGTVADNEKPEPARTTVDNTRSMADIGITLKNTIAGAVILVFFTVVAAVKGASASYPTADTVTDSSLNVIGAVSRRHQLLPKSLHSPIIDVFSQCALSLLFEQLSSCLTYSERLN